MEWMAVIGNSIQYIEAHITEPLTIEAIARAVNVSPFYFQKGFALLCGFTVSEYLRNRRLALAGNDLAATDEKGDRHCAEVRLRFAGRLHQGVHPLSRRNADGRAQRRRAAEVLCPAENSIFT